MLRYNFLFDCCLVGAADGYELVGYFGSPVGFN